MGTPVKRAGLPDLFLSKAGITEKIACKIVAFRAMCNGFQLGRRLARSLYVAKPFQPLQHLLVGLLSLTRKLRRGL